MRPCQGPTMDVANWLTSTDADKISHSDLIGALVNAMTRIANLEARLAKAERTAYHANNVASCLANGVKPD